MSQRLHLHVLGVGAGSTHAYHGQCSAAFMLLVDDAPFLMMDVVSARSRQNAPVTPYDYSDLYHISQGGGVVHAALTQVKALPPAVYVSHNHTDHSGESIV